MVDLVFFRDPNIRLICVLRALGLGHLHGLDELCVADYRVDILLKLGLDLVTVHSLLHEGLLPVLLDVGLNVFTALIDVV